MGTLIPSLNAYRYLRGKMTADSWTAGWRSLLLRGYDDPPVVEEMTTPATADHLLVLVTSGSCAIEGRYGKGWQSAVYHEGDIGMTAPGQEATLRWRGQTRHTTLQLHLPEENLRRIADELGGPSVMPSRLAETDPVIASVMRGLGQALDRRAPDLYAAAAGELLATHLLVRYAGFAAPPSRLRDDARLRRADAFLHENIGSDVTLEAIAHAAGMSRFHLVRLFKTAYGATPFKRLTQLRMEEARRRLARDDAPVTDIAAACGYENPAHFASAFRRVVGISPSDYRRNRR